MKTNIKWWPYKNKNGELEMGAAFNIFMLVSMIILVIGFFTLVLPIL